MKAGTKKMLEGNVENYLYTGDCDYCDTKATEVIALHALAASGYNGHVMSCCTVCANPTLLKKIGNKIHRRLTAIKRGYRIAKLHTVEEGILTYKVAAGIATDAERKTWRGVTLDRRRPNRVA